MHDHLKRYGKRGRSDEVATVEVLGDGKVAWRGKAYDLRRGEPLGPAPRLGFAFGRGRHLRYGGGGVEAVHEDGRVVALEGTARLAPATVFHVGDALVFSVQGHAEPWSVVDCVTGKLKGRLEGQGKDSKLGMYYPAVFDPADGTHLWLGEGARLRCFDVASMAWRAEVPMPTGSKAVAFAMGVDGSAAVFLRPEHVELDGASDTLALLDPRGKETGRAAGLGASSGIGRLGEGFVVVEHGARRFRIFDARLGDVESVPMMPDDDWARLLVLPSGREWIAIGGHGQWDHYGEPGLGPEGASRVIEGAAPSAVKGKAPAKRAAKGKAPRD